VSDVCNLLMPLADARAVVVQVEQPLHALEVVANASALRRLILILVDNAIKFSREAGRVTVKIWKADKAIQLAVEDSGPGIPSEELPRIFDRFYRSPEASDNGRGAGLGLSLAAGIAEHHRARIDVASTDGVGSTFSVAFPVEDFIDGSKRQA
jgi:signal transduction histidine kinase